MAIIILGKSKCSICNKTLNEGDVVKSFPAFLPSDHRYGRFSDAGFHKDCVESDPDYTEVENMLYVYNKILDSRPKDLKDVKEIEAWMQDAFQAWPPKNGVVVFEQMFPDDTKEPDWWWTDKDMWEEFEKAEREENEKLEARREESRRLEREAWRYSRDD